MKSDLPYKLNSLLPRPFDQPSQRFLVRESSETGCSLLGRQQGDQAALPSRRKPEKEIPRLVAAAMKAMSFIQKAESRWVRGRSGHPHSASWGFQ